jgi:CSLREA domain-containing protein
VRKGSIAVLLVLGALLAWVNPAAAAITVNTTADETTPGDGGCSLREGVLAIDGTPEPDCLGTGVITLPAGTYNLTLGSSLPITAPTAIEGSGLSVIEGDGSDRVLMITASQASISGVTISGGRTPDAGPGASSDPGGGIYNSGALTIRDSVISGNSTGNGGLDSASCASGGGGGIANLGDLTLIRVTLTGNNTGNGEAGGCAVGDGGGILNQGSLSVSASTIANNRAGSGGGIWSQATATASLVNSTVVLNTASENGGGIAILQGTMNIASSTIAGNSAQAGGGIMVDPAAGASEQDALVASNAPSNCAGAVSDFGHDLSFPEASCPHAVTGDPRLGPLGNYGGPTPMLSLGTGSSAIDQVPSSGAACPSTDQRGVVRPQGAACDIGAYEAASPVCRPVASATHGIRAVIVQLSCADPSGLPVQYALVSGARHGRLTSFGQSSGRVTYTARSAFSGVDQFTYRASNANGVSGAQSATITVAPVPMVIAGARFTKRRFRAGKGTTLQFSLAAAARVRITISRTRREEPETLGSFSVRERAGTITLAFTGRLHGAKLAPGRYQATLVASAGPVHSAPVALSFVIL